jgi:molecular chaperone HtpG
MISINLPERFKKKLDLDDYYTALVFTVLESFGQILKENKLFFFEEYTNHGVAHIEQVLIASDNLIPIDTFDHILTSKDIAYYILAVILHDLGMHIRAEGLLSLISGENDMLLNNDLDSCTWSQLWNEYVAEAKRFEKKQLLEIFGPDLKNNVIQIPDLVHPDSIDGYQRKLVGEFIRRHHPRLAHEIALKGFPALNFLGFASILPEKERYMIGLIARSHGFDLRQSVDHTEFRFGRPSLPVTFGIHTTYLMVLLRLADYLQIDKTRTSIVLLKLRSLSSPISKIEHAAHLAIEPIEMDYQQDPERLFVTADPLDSIMYFKLKRLFTGIQHEFDQSWAVLGEYYGHNPKKPLIRFRRIVSNLDNSSFKERLRYVPDEFSFKVNEKLIPSLVAPLYGNNPTYGVREMLQNAIDACKERKILESDNVEYEPKVYVSVIEDNGKRYFEINDNGIGMDILVIKEYFLIAGASYRDSGLWRGAFVSDAGETKVLRTGRFGIGALAAFLIGNEIEVTTRKLGKATGYVFKASIDSDGIQIWKNENSKVGTTIRIPLNYSMYAWFEKDWHVKDDGYWHNWYSLSSPEVVSSFNGFQIKKTEAYPDLNDDLPSEWNIIHPKGYDGVLWTYEQKKNRATVACNGFFIKSQDIFSIPGLQGVRMPSLSIFDSAGKLPLSLDRNRLTGDLPFFKELRQDVYKDFIAYLLSLDTKNYSGNDRAFLLKGFFEYPGFNLKGFRDEFLTFGNQSYTSRPTSFSLYYPLFGKEGFILDYPYFIKKMNGVSALAIIAEKGSSAKIDYDFGNTYIKIFVKGEFYHSSDQSEFYDAAISPLSESKRKTPALIAVKSYVFKKYLASQIKEKKIEPAGYLGQGNWVKIDYGIPRKTVITEDLISAINESSLKVELIRDYDIQTKEIGDKDLNALLHRYFGNDVIIPYDMEERRRKFPRAFKELNRFINKYLKK